MNLEHSLVNIFSLVPFSLLESEPVMAITLVYISSCFSLLTHCNYLELDINH